MAVNREMALRHIVRFIAVFPPVDFLGAISIQRQSGD
jgi:hypothetical protein